MIAVRIMKNKKNLKTRVGIFKNMGGNIPDGNFPEWNPPGSSLMGGNFPGGSFPDTLNIMELLLIIELLNIQLLK